jgi:hypothetical protein
VGHGVVHDAEPRRVRTEVGAHSLPRCDPTANPVRCAPCGLVVNPQW